MENQDSPINIRETVLEVINSLRSVARLSSSAGVKSDGGATKLKVTVAVLRALAEPKVTSFCRTLDTLARKGSVCSELAPLIIKELSGWPKVTVERVYFPVDRGSYVRVWAVMFPNGMRLLW